MALVLINNQLWVPINNRTLYVYLLYYFDAIITASYSTVLLVALKVSFTVYRNLVSTCPYNIMQSLILSLHMLHLPIPVKSQK